MKSLLSNEKVCFVCGTTNDIHRHHIYGGLGRRSLSERDGCWIYLCAAHHNMSARGIHFDKELDMRVKALCQEKWEERYGSTQDFIRRFGRSYK